MDGPGFEAVFEAPSGVARARSRQKKMTAAQSAAQRLSAYMSSARMCCAKDCAGNMLRRPGGLDVVLQWRQGWECLKKRVQHEAVLQFLRRYATSAPRVPAASFDDANATAALRRGRCIFRYHFLGVFLCRRGWQTLTGVSSWVLCAARTRWARGEIVFERRKKATNPALMNSMAGAIWALTESLQEKMPLKDVPQEHIIMPVHHHIMLFRMLQDWHTATVEDTVATSAFLQHWQASDDVAPI